MTTRPVEEAFASCPKDLEGLLAVELADLGALGIEQTRAGVRFRAGRDHLYRICLGSRLASRVLLPLGRFEGDDADALYEGMHSIPWPDHFTSATTFAIEFIGTTATIRDRGYGARRAKDAVVDLFRERTGSRPDVDTCAPQIRLSVRAYRGTFTASLDLSGESLHRRGYRLAAGPAPLKENLAAAILYRAGWPAIASDRGALIDPMCGSGTLLVEGAMIALGIAPGLKRTAWGFDQWLGHQEASWRQVHDEAREKRAAALAGVLPDILGYDENARMVETALANAARAELEPVVRVRRKALHRLVRPTHKDLTPGLVVTNPPHGERLGDEASLVDLYRCLGQRLKQEFTGWQAAVFTGNPALGKTMGLRARKQHRLYNGALESKLLLFDVATAHFVGGTRTGERAVSPSPPVLGAGAEMFANRLRKNQRRLGKWLRANRVGCYRLYDADMPEYAVAVDVYADWAHVAEYRAPASVDPEAAERRLREVIIATPAVLDIPSAHVVVKERRRQRGPDQYARHSSTGRFLEIREGAVELLVNLHDYIDTGLFLDHRILRRWLGETLAGKRFLNLFCYTAAASVHAAAGGARSSTSVDLSPSYLAWAERNFALNRVNLTRHQLVRADCLEWLSTNRQRFDVVLLDPPTFSNSKRMGESFDVQRDHADLIRRCMDHVDHDGTLVFSASRQRFELSAHLADRFAIEDVTGWSVDRDFERGRPPHRCWFIRHRG